MDAGGPVDDIGLIDMDCEGDSLLGIVDCQADPTRSYAFSPAGVSSDKHGLRLKEKFLNPLPGDNNVCKSKCLSPNGDDKENLPLVVDDSIGSLLVSDDPQQEKKRKKAKGFNLRKSLAWHRAFFTEEGVLDTSELSVFNGSFSQSTNAKLPTVSEVDDASLSSDGLGSSDLRVQTIKEEISNESHKKKPQLQDRKPAASSSINPASLKMKNALASNKMSTATTRRVGQVGACLQPPHSNSQRSQILGKTVHSMSGAQKQKAAKAGLTMGSINPVVDGRHLKSMDKDNVQKQFSAKGRAGTNIQRFQAPPGLSNKQPGKSSTRNFSMKAADSKGKSKKPQSRQELDICKASLRVKSVYNHIDENAGQLSSASSSSVDPSTGNNIHNRQRGGTFSRHLSGSSHTAGTTKDTLDTENTKQDPGLQDRKSELSAVSCQSKLVLPVYQNTKCTAENLLPSHLPKPSALKMPSPTLGFFGQAKAFGAHIQTHKNALEACSSAHGSSSAKGSCLPQVGNFINGCLPPSAKVSRPTSAIVGAVTSQIRPHSSYKNSTGADLPSAVCPEPKPTLEARLPGKLKIEAPFDPEKCRNESDVQILMEANLEAGNVLIEEKHENDKCVDESMSNGNHRHNNQKVVDIDQSVKPVGTQSPNKEKHHDDENSYKYLLVGSNSKGMQNDKPLHFVNNGIDRKHESMTFPCSRLSEVPSIGREVQIESMPVEICDTQCGCETAVGKPLTNNQCMVSGLSIPDTGAESFSPKKPIEICNPVIDKKRQDTEETPFNGSIALDAGHASERKRLRSSGSTFDGRLEATSNEVVDMVTDPSDFQEYANSLFTTTTGEGTTNDDREEMSGFLSTEDKSNLQGIDVGIIQENSSHSCRQSTKDLLVSLSFELPTSEEKNVARSGNLDSMMNDKVEQTARASDNSVDDNTVHYKCKINNQGGPLLGCSSSYLSQDIEVATSHTVRAMDEEFANIDSHGSINEWINSEKDVHAQEEEMGDSQLTHLMMDRPSGMNGELASCVEITQAVERACYSDYGANNTSEKTLEFPTSKGDSKVVGEAAQGDLENGTSSAQGPIVSNNWMPSDCERQEPVSMRYPVDVEPFSDEWISAMEAAGEAVLKKKSGAVQNSPPDKVLPEPGPWSPVKRKSQDLGPFDCTKYTIPLSNSTGGNSGHESSC